MHTAHLHTQVVGFDNNADPFGFYGFDQSLADLVSHALLYLQAAGEDIDQTGNFGQPNDLTVGNIADMTFAKEG